MHDRPHAIVICAEICDPYRLNMRQAIDRAVSQPSDCPGIAQEGENGR